MMPIDLVLLRHGEAEGNIAADRSKKGDHALFTPEFKQRHSSIWRLTDRGIKQAQAAGVWMKNHLGVHFFDRYHTSTHLRSMETAYNLNLPAIWYPDIDLRERDWGIFDCMSQEERHEKFAEVFKRRSIDGFYWRPTGGETMAELYIRAFKIPIDTLHRECSAKRVLIVSHGEVMWIWRFGLERMYLDQYRDLDNSKNTFDKIHNCQILHYSRRDPVSGELSPHLDWMRSICPWDISISSNEWREIKRPIYTNSELERIVSQVPRVIY
ncbi:MAG: histidine phosphatase family protein [Candidatus Sungbacteria bacterium]|nr:histidine phosphatase family protein [Candidatus Sungbacteria bacterium]